MRSSRLDNTGGWLINDQRFIEWWDSGNEHQHEQRVLCCYGKPLSVTIYTSPLSALGVHLRCTSAGAFGYMGNSCLIPAGVAITTFCSLHPSSTSVLALASASSLPFTHIAGRGHCGVIGILLREAEVNPNSTCTLQITHALWGKMTNAAKTLPSNHRVDRSTALHLAVEPRELEVFKLLLRDPRVDLNYKHNGGYTPIALAARYRYTEAVKLLLGNPRVDPNHEGSIHL